MDKKKLSPKQIFRTIAFQYHQDDKIQLTLLAQIVSWIHYPNDKIGEARKKYKMLLINLLKDYTQQQKKISQQQFVNFMIQMNKHTNQQYTKKTALRIFNRYKNQQNVIDQKGFTNMYQCLKLQPKQMLSYFYNIADRKNQITFEKFLDFINSMEI